ncbi:hypothetical protein Pelo_12283 [Pelomyxa schiedti]|nr:hypothetical protein Pelo_12283 [Pelomyxa schiedti]
MYVDKAPGKYPREIRIPVFYDLINDRVRDNFFTIATLMIVFCMVATLLLFSVFRDPRNALGENTPNKMNMFVQPPVYVVIGEPLEQVPWLYVKNLEGFPADGWDIVVSVEQIATNITSLDCIGIVNPLKIIQFTPMCTPVLAGFSNTTSANGDAMFNDFVIQSGIIGRYTLRFSFADESLSSLSQTATVSVESKVGNILQLTAIPTEWDTATPIDLEVKVIDTNGEPLSGKRVLLFSNPADYYTQYMLTEDLRTPKFAIVSPIEAYSTITGKATFKGLTLNASNFGELYIMAVCEQAFKFLFTSEGLIPKVKTDVASVIIISDPPSSVKEGSQFDMVLKVVDGDGHALQGKVVIAMITEWNGRRRGPYEASYESWIPIKYLDNPVSPPTNSSGFATMSMSFLVRGPPGPHRITFFCEGVESLESDIINVTTTVAGFVSVYSLNAKNQIGVTLQSPVILIFDESGQGIPGKIAFLESEVGTAFHYYPVASDNQGLALFGDLLTARVDADWENRTYSAIISVDGIAAPFQWGVSDPQENSHLCSDIEVILNEESYCQVQIGQPFTIGIRVFNGESEPMTSYYNNNLDYNLLSDMIIYTASQEYRQITSSDDVILTSGANGWIFDAHFQIDDGYPGEYWGELYLVQTYSSFTETVVQDCSSAFFMIKIDNPIVKVHISSVATININEEFYIQALALDSSNNSVSWNYAYLRQQACPPVYATLCTTSNPCVSFNKETLGVTLIYPGSYWFYLQLDGIQSEEYIHVVAQAPVQNAVIIVEAALRNGSLCEPFSIQPIVLLTPSTGGNLTGTRMLAINCDTLDLDFSFDEAVVASLSSVSPQSEIWGWSTPVDNTGLAVFNDIGVISLGSGKLKICFVLDGTILEPVSEIDLSLWTITLELLRQPSAVIAPQQPFSQPPIIKMLAERASEDGRVSCYIPFPVVLTTVKSVDGTGVAVPQYPVQIGSNTEITFESWIISLGVAGKSYKMCFLTLSTDEDSICTREFDLTAMASTIEIVSGPRPTRMFLGGVMCFTLQARIAGDSGLEEYDMKVVVAQQPDSEMQIARASDETSQATTGSGGFVEFCFRLIDAPAGNYSVQFVGLNDERKSDVSDTFEILNDLSIVETTTQPAGLTTPTVLVEKCVVVGDDEAAEISSLRQPQLIIYDLYGTPSFGRRVQVFVARREYEDVSKEEKSLQERLSPETTISYNTGQLTNENGVYIFSDLHFVSGSSGFYSFVFFCDGIFIESDRFHLYNLQSPDVSSFSLIKNLVYVLMILVIPMFFANSTWASTRFVFRLSVILSIIVAIILLLFGAVVTALAIVLQGEPDPFSICLATIFFSVYAFLAVTLGVIVYLAISGHNHLTREVARMTNWKEHCSKLVERPPPAIPMPSLSPEASLIEKAIFKIRYYFFSPAPNQHKWLESWSSFTFPQRFLLAAGLSFLCLLYCYLATFWVEYWISYSIQVAKNGMIDLEIKAIDSAVSVANKLGLDVDIPSAIGFGSQIVSEMINSLSSQDLGNGGNIILLLAQKLYAITSESGPGGVLDAIGEKVISSGQAAAAVTLVIGLLMWLLLFYSYRNNVMLVRQGKVVVDPRSVSLSTASNYVGMQVSHTAIAYFVVFAVLWVIFFIFGYTGLMIDIIKNIHRRFNYTLIISIITTIVRMLFVTLVVDMFWLDHLVIIHRRLFALYDFANTFVGILAGITSSIIRLATAIGMTFLFFFRMDYPLIGMQDLVFMDKGYSAFASMFITDNIYNNPATNVFLHVLSQANQQHKEKEKETRGDPGSAAKDKPTSRLHAQNKWALLATLSCNRNLKEKRYHAIIEAKEREEQELKEQKMEAGHYENDGSEMEVQLDVLKPSSSKSNPDNV